MRPSIKSPCVADRHEVRDGRVRSACARVAEVSFDHGKGALIRATEAGVPLIEVYRTDGEVRVIVDHSANAKAHARALLAESADRAAAWNEALHRIDNAKALAGFNALIDALLWGEVALIIHDNREG